MIRITVERTSVRQEIAEVFIERDPLVGLRAEDALRYVERIEAEERLFRLSHGR